MDISMYAFGFLLSVSVSIELIQNWFSHSLNGEPTSNLEIYTFAHILISLFLE